MERLLPRPSPTRERVSSRAGLVGAFAFLWLMLCGAAEPVVDFLRTEAEPGNPGGTLVVAMRAEPKTFNPVLAVDNPSLTVIRRLMADLIHIDRATHRTVAALAKDWSVSPDGRRYTLELRRGIRFSDGHPLDADDVLFTFEVYIDEATASPHRALLSVGGVPISVRKTGSYTLVFELAKPYAVGERLFDSVPILPRHRLDKIFREGGLATAWGPTTPPEEIVGLGPFRVEKFVPGERLELARNPHYWKVDSKGQRLPYLDRLIFLFVSNEDAQTIRFQTGEAHLTDRIGARNFALLEREKARYGYILRDLGASLNYNFLFFNLNALDRPAGITQKQKWFRQVAFRRAVSSAIDREGIVRLVYQGRATPIITHETPGSSWIHPSLTQPERSLETSRRLLRSAGFRWRDDGHLLDDTGIAVEFSILTSASNQDRLGIATIIQADLEQLGMTVRVVPLEFQTLVERVLGNHDYEASILAFGAGDSDPNSAIAMLTSKGSNHLWQLRQPATLSPWQIEIDRLMAQQLVTRDPKVRKQLYDRVQFLVAENLPMIFLVSPNVLTGAAGGLGNFKPAILSHFTLWNVDELFWRTDDGN